MFYELFDDFNPKLSHLIVAVDLGSDSASHGERRVEEYEIELIFSGTGYVTVDGVNFPTHPHSIHFRRPGMIVEGRGSYKSRYFTFSQETATSSTDGLCEMPIVYRLDNNDFEQAHSLFNLIFYCHYNDTYTKNITQKRVILELFEIMLNNWHHATQTEFFDTQTVQNMQISINFIRDNFKQRLTIEELSSNIGYSASYFSRLFKKYTAWTPMQYLNNHRLVVAKERLIETDDNIETVGAECGFDNPIYFYRIFKKHTGCTPNQYRKNHRYAQHI